MTEPFDSGAAPPLLDAWTLAHPGIAHPPSAGVYEDSWAKPPHCCDFIFVSADLAARVRSVTIDVTTQASDHQPVLIEFAD